MNQIPPYQEHHTINHLFSNDDFLLIAERAYTPLPTTLEPDTSEMLAAISMLPAWVFKWGPQPSLAFLPFAETEEKDGARVILLSPGKYAINNNRILQFNSEGSPITLSIFPPETVYHNLAEDHYSSPEVRAALIACFTAFEGPCEREEQLNFLATSFGDLAMFTYHLFFQRLILLDKRSLLYVELTPAKFIKHTKR